MKLSLIPVLENFGCLLCRACPSNSALPIVIPPPCGRLAQSHGDGRRRNSTIDKRMVCFFFFSVLFPLPSFHDAPPSGSPIPHGCPIKPVNPKTSHLLCFLVLAILARTDFSIICFRVPLFGNKVVLFFSFFPDLFFFLYLFSLALTLSGFVV